MSVSNGKITAPVSIDDVKTVLGESSNDLATLCTSPKINVWAKYKPTVYPSPFPDDWYKAKDGNYGLNITVENAKNNWTDIVAEYSKINNGYGNLYNRPTGGANAPYRLGDFRGYNHNAKPEIKDYIGKTQYINSNDIVLDVDYNIITVDGDQISYKEISVFKDLYFGYIILNSIGQLSKIITAPSTIAQGGYRVTIKASSTLSKGLYRAYPMFCNVDYSSSDTLKQMHLYAVPNLAGGKSFNVIYYSDTVMNKFQSISAIKNSLGVIIVSITTKASVSSCYVYFVYQSDPSNGEALIMGESYRNVGAIGAGKTKTLLFTPPVTGKNYKIYVSSENAWVVKGLFPMQEVIPEV